MRRRFGGYCTHAHARAGCQRRNGRGAGLAQQGVREVRLEICSSLPCAASSAKTGARRHGGRRAYLLASRSRRAREALERERRRRWAGGRRRVAPPAGDAGAILDGRELFGGLTGCRGCAPGGDCSAAYKGGAGQCCGNRNGVAFCCPHFTQGAKCAACVESYRCFSTARRPRDICAADGGDLRAPGADIEPNAVASLLIFVMFVASITCACVACARARRAQPKVTTVQMPPMGSLPPAGLAVGTVVTVGSVVAGQPVVHHHHGGGGGGTVGMGAGMGFLGGMMMGEMIADAGHSGYGGDYGGGGGGDFGGDFAADM